MRSTTDENNTARVYCTLAVRANSASIRSALNRCSNTPRAITQIGRCFANGSKIFPSAIDILAPPSQDLFSLREAQSYQKIAAPWKGWGKVGHTPAAKVQ